MKQFYSHLVVVESLTEELHQMDLSKEEHEHLAALITSSLHHAILDEILSHLSISDKRVFIKLLSEEGENEKLMEFLQGKIEGVEGKIKKVADELILEMHQDIKEAKGAKR